MARHRRCGAETETDNTPPARRPLEPLNIPSSVSPLSLAVPSVVMPRIDTSLGFEAARLPEFEESDGPSRESNPYAGFSLIPFTIFESTLTQRPRPGYTRIPPKSGAQTRPLSRFSKTGIPFHGDPCRRREIRPASCTRRKPTRTILPAPGLSFLILYRPAVRIRFRVT